MKANELRIGNWVNLKYSGQGEFGTLSEDKFVQVDSLEYDHLLKDMLPDSYCINNYDRKHFQPIPLSAELLEKCGFEHEEKEGAICENYHVYTLGDLTYNTSHPGWWYRNTNWGMTDTLKYLHQLQNLYYALTQTELQINL